MKFKTFLYESDLSNKSLTELEEMLKSLEEQDPKDINKIKSVKEAIGDVKKKSMKAPGNQNMGSSDSIAQDSAGSAVAAE